MKTIYLVDGLLILCLSILSEYSYAQDSTRIFKKFKMDLGFGIDLPQDLPGPGYTFGILFYIEPKYHFKDQWNLGIRLESAPLPRDIEDWFKGKSGVESKILTSEYYFNNSKYRPYAGLGLGMSTITARDDPNPYGTDVFCGMIRWGIESPHHHYAIEYTISGNTSYSSKNNYLGLKFGWLIGGKRIKKVANT
jgi:outer membrane protein X